MVQEAKPEAVCPEGVGADLDWERIVLSLPRKPDTTVRFFERGGCYTVLREDARLAACELRHNPDVIRQLGRAPGSQKLEIVVLNKVDFESFVRDLLLVRHYRVEVRKNKAESESVNEDYWYLAHQCSPGKLEQCEDFLFANASAQNACVCQENNNCITNCELDNKCCNYKGVCSSISSDNPFVTSKCLLMKAEVTGSKSGRREKPKDAFEDTDGLYDPECDYAGAFKTKGYYETTCCMNAAGVRRTDKQDAESEGSQLVRRMSIEMKLKHAERNAPLKAESIEKNLMDTFTSRYQLPRRNINIKYEKPYITIDLKQNSSDKSVGDVDIADVAHKFEKDVKSQSIFHNNAGINISIDNEPVKIVKISRAYCIGEIAPESSMKSLTPGLIAVPVLALIAVVIVVLIWRWRKKRKNKKSEMKEMNGIKEMKEMNGIKEMKEMNGINEMMEMKEMKEINFINEIKEINQINENNQTNENNQINQIMKVMKCIEN